MFTMGVSKRGSHKDYCGVPMLTQSMIANDILTESVWGFLLNIAFWVFW